MCVCVFSELVRSCQEWRCQFDCVIMRNGTSCFCREGFELDEDGRRCRGEGRYHLKLFEEFKALEISLHLIVLLWLQQDKI